MFDRNKSPSLHTTDVTCVRSLFQASMLKNEYSESAETTRLAIPSKLGGGFIAITPRSISTRHYAAELWCNQGWCNGLLKSRINNDVSLERVGACAITFGKEPTTDECLVLLASVYGVNFLDAVDDLGENELKSFATWTVIYYQRDIHMAKLIWSSMLDKESTWVRVGEQIDDIMYIIPGSPVVIVKKNFVFSTFSAYHCEARSAQVDKLVRLISYIHGDVLQRIVSENPASDTFSMFSGSYIDLALELLESDTAAPITSYQQWFHFAEFIQKPIEAPYIEESGGWDTLSASDVAIYDWCIEKYVAKSVEVLPLFDDISEESLAMIEASVLENGLIKAINLECNGKLRVVLKEQVYPTMISCAGRLLEEDECGSVINSNLGLIAFVIDFGEGYSNFPPIKAYSDEGCTVPALHPNINRDGNVCLGELAQRYDGSPPCIADFLQMLRLINLDSAFNSDKSFTIGSTHEAVNWGRRDMHIPGMHDVSIVFNI